MIFIIFSFHNLLKNICKIIVRMGVYIIFYQQLKGQEVDKLMQSFDSSLVNLQNKIDNELMTIEPYPLFSPEYANCIIHSIVILHNRICFFILLFHLSGDELYYDLLLISVVYNRNKSERLQEDLPYSNGRDHNCLVSQTLLSNTLQHDKASYLT